MSETMVTQRKWWNRLSVRWSFRSFLVFVLVFSIRLAWISNQARVQRNAVAAIEKAGGKVYYDFQTKPVPGQPENMVNRDPKGVSRWPAWMVSRLGPDLFHSVRIVDLRGDADAVAPLLGQLRDINEVTLMSSPETGEITLSDEGIKHLSNLKYLWRLKVGFPLQTRINRKIKGSLLTGKGIEQLRNCAHLTHLELDGAFQLKNDDLAALKSLPSLESLTLSSSRITGEGLKHVAVLKNLNTLRLDFTQVDNEGIASLRPLENLKSLSCSMTRVNSLEPFRHLPRLRSLQLAGTELGDEGLTPLSGDPGFPSLVSLNLDGTKVTNQGILQLGTLPRLKEFSVRGTSVNREGYDVFRRQFPRIDFSYLDRPVRAKAPNATAK